MSKKKITQSIIVLLIFVFLVSCNPSSAPKTNLPPSTSESGAPLTNPSQTGETPVENSKEVIKDEMVVPSREDGYIGPELTNEKINLSILRSSLRPEQEELIAIWYEEFMNAHPNITIEEEVVPFGEIAQKVQVMVAADALPDIIYGDGPYIKSYVYNDLILPLDDYVSKEFIDDIVPASRAELSVDGKLYSFPWEQGTMLMYYNKEMFENAGIPIPEETSSPEAGYSWDQALDIWKKLTVDPSGTGSPTVWGLGPSGFGPGGPGSNYYFEGIFLRSFGDKNAPEESSAYKTFLGLSPDGTVASGYVDTPEAVAAMEFYQSLFQEHKVTPTGAIPDSFVSQTAATFILSDIGIDRYQNLDFTVGYTPVPHGASLVNHGGSTSYMINKKTKHPAEAAAYLVYIHNTINRVRWAEARGSLPARISVLDLMPKYQEYPYSLVNNILLNYTYPRPATAGYSEFQSIMDAAIKDIALGASPQEYLENAAAEIDAALAKYK